MSLQAVVLVVGAFASAVLVQAQTVSCVGKLSENKVEALLSGGVAQPRVEQIARTCGIDFEVTPVVASRLRRAGAGSGLIGALREIQPKRPEPVVKQDTPPVKPGEKPKEASAPPPEKPKTTAAPPPERPKEPAAPPAGSKRVNPKDGLTYVWIPAGTFTMGCSPGDNECSEDEKPAHQLTITKGFWIGQTEVTQAAYERVKVSNPSTIKGASLPVETINWDEARAYCEAVGTRMPTEAEWEYAARGGNSSARYGKLAAVAWYSGNSGSKTHDVAQKQPNGYGLYDTLGNVWEWTADWYDASYYGSSPRSDPQGPSSGRFRTLRGGSWYDNPWRARVSLRNWSVPGIRFNYFGVRCVGE